MLVHYYMKYITCICSECYEKPSRGSKILVDFTFKRKNITLLHTFDVNIWCPKMIENVV